MGNLRKVFSFNVKGKIDFSIFTYKTIYFEKGMKILLNVFDMRRKMKGEKIKSFHIKILKEKKYEK